MGRKSVKAVLWVSADGLRVVDDKTKVGLERAGMGTAALLPSFGSHPRGPLLDCPMGTGMTQLTSQLGVNLCLPSAGIERDCEPRLGF